MILIRLSREAEIWEPRMPIDNLIPIIHEHILRYPEIQAQDVYKLLHQRHLGPAHLIEDIESARRYFKREYDSVIPDKGNILVENISHDFTVVRINLSPFKAGMYPGMKLFKAFIESASLKTGNIDNFLRDWKGLIKLTREEDMGLNTNDLEELDASVKEKGYPAIRHSKIYLEKYKPSYRVVYTEVLIKHLPEFRDFTGNI
jgi:hypothetical protein